MQAERDHEAWKHKQNAEAYERERARAEQAEAALATERAMSERLRDLVLSARKFVAYCGPGPDVDAWLALAAQPDAGVGE